MYVNPADRPCQGSPQRRPILDWQCGFIFGGRGGAVGTRARTRCRQGPAASHDHGRGAPRWRNAMGQTIGGRPLCARKRSWAIGAEARAPDRYACVRPQTCLQPSLRGNRRGAQYGGSRRLACVLEMNFGFTPRVHSQEGEAKTAAHQSWGILAPVVRQAVSSPTPPAHTEADAGCASIWCVCSGGC